MAKTVTQPEASSPTSFELLEAWAIQLGKLAEELATLAAEERAKLDERKEDESNDTV